jgi:hypothetical protein
MRLQTRHEYAAAPADVFGMLTDAAFLRAKLETRGDTDVEVVECASAADGFRIITRRTVALNVPGFAKRFVRPTNAVTQTDVWSEPDGDGSRTGTWRVEARGVPVTMAGTMTLTRGPRGSVEDIDGKVSSTIPIVGGRLAAFVGGTAQANLAEEHDFARRWLSARTS